MKKHYTSKYNPAVAELSEVLNKGTNDGSIRPVIASKIKNVLDGVERMDEMISQKEQLLVQKDNNINKLQGSIFDKEQKEFIEVLPQRYPHDYPTNFNEWPNDIWGKQVVERKDLNAIEKHLPTFKADLLKKEWIEVLHKRFPNDYPARFEDWNPNIWGKQVIDRNNIDTIKHWLPIYRQEVIQNLSQSILTERTKIQELLVEKENEQQKLIDKDNLLSDQTEDIERINVLLETKKIIIQRLEQEKEILQTRHDILDMKMQLTVKEFTVREREKDKALLEKDNELKKLAESSKLLAGYKEEMLKFKELCETKEAEIKEKDELLAQKEVEKVVLVDDLQEKLYSKDSEILGLKMMVNEMNLAGDHHIEDLN